MKTAEVDTIGKENSRLCLKAIDRPLAICAVNYTRGSPKIVCSRGLASGEASDATVLEAVLASAPAPTYFPPQVHRGEILINGGLIANAPELLAVNEGCGEFGWRIEGTYVLALGTASRRQGAALTSPGRPSTISWMVRRQLFQATMAAQEVLAAAQCKTLLGERYLRIDHEPAEKQVNAIREFDRANNEAKKTLQSLASESWNEHQGDVRLRSFFS